MAQGAAQFSFLLGEFMGDREIKVKALAAILWLGPSVALGGSLTLNCEGLTKGPNISDSPSSMIVEIDTVTKKIKRISPMPAACVFGEVKSKQTTVFEDSTAFACENDLAEVYVDVSRYDFKTQVTTRWFKRGEKDEVFWLGRFSCSEAKRKF